MTLREFANYIIENPREIHGDIYDSLDAGDHTQIIGCRASGKSTIIAVYVAHHLLFNEQDSGRTIMLSSFSSYAGKAIITRAKEFVRLFIKKAAICDRFGNLIEPFPNTDTKLRAISWMDNEVEFFLSDKVEAFRGKGSIRAVIVDEFNRSWDIVKVHDMLTYNSMITDSQVVIVGKRVKREKDLDFNAYPINYWDLPNFDAKEAFRFLNGNDRLFHFDFERVTPYFD